MKSKAVKDIVYFLMMYGGWEATDEVVTKGDQIVKIVWTAEPPARDPNEDFEVVGSLSRMYSTLFELGTTGAHGATAIDISIEPGMMATLIPHSFKSPELPLWRFYVQPSP